MENILMIFCRRRNAYSLKHIATFLDLTISEYQKLEKGDTLMTADQAKKLASLYHGNPSLFYDSALQLDLLKARGAIIELLKTDLEILKIENEDHLAEMKLLP
jgi:transcriptional regulator with XRE-family HTH domain